MEALRRRRSIATLDRQLFCQGRHSAIKSPRRASRTPKVPKKDGDRAELGLPPWEPRFEAIPLMEKKKNFILHLKEILKRQDDFVIQTNRLGRMRTELEIVRNGKNRKISGIVRKFPGAFELYKDEDNKVWCGFTDAAMELLEEEKRIISSCEGDLVVVLRKLLMMSLNGRICAVKLMKTRMCLGMPDDFLQNLVPKYPEYFRLRNLSGYLFVELVCWDSELAISAVEKSSQMCTEDNLFYKKRNKTVEGMEGAFKLHGYRWGDCLFEPPWDVEPEEMPQEETMSIPREDGQRLVGPRFKWKTKKNRASGKRRAQWIEEFQSVPYISPYENWYEVGLSQELVTIEKRAVAMVHEFLSLTVEKRCSLDKLRVFVKEFYLPYRLLEFLRRYDGIFYVAVTDKKTIVFLKEAYDQGHLLVKSPLTEWNKWFVDLAIGVEGKAPDGEETEYD